MARSKTVVVEEARLSPLGTRLSVYLGLQQEQSPDRRWTLDELAEETGLARDEVVMAVSELLRRADYRASDPGPAWLDEHSYREVITGRLELPGMPKPEYGFYQGFPVAEVSIRILSTKVLEQALADAVSRLGSRVQLEIEAIVEGDAHAPVGTKREATAELAYKAVVVLRPTAVRVVS